MKRISLTLLPALFLSFFQLFAQDSTLLLIGETLELGEINIKSLRFATQERKAAVPIEVIRKDALVRQSGISLSDLVSKEPGIALYRDGAWGTSLSVRGLGEKRLVVMVNGNRVETATDLAAGLSMIDLLEIERVEVIKGAASSIYGTGAMGGVVNLITKTGEYGRQGIIHGEVTGYYQDVNQLLGSHLSLESGGENWYLRAGGGYRQADDMKTPEGILDNSQFTDYNYNISAGIKPWKNHELTLNFQDFIASDVGIPGGAAFAPSATATYLEARRRMASAGYSISLPGRSLTQIRFKYFNQLVNRDVEMHPNVPSRIIGNQRITANLILPKGAHYTNGFTTETDWSISANHSILAGVDIWERRVLTSREKFITQEILDDFQMVIQTNELVRGEQPIPDSRFNSSGIFVQDQISLLDGKLDIQTGVRMDGIYVLNEEARDPVFFRMNGVEKDPVPGQRIVFEAQQQFDLSWSLNSGMLYHLTNAQDISVNIGRSFRSPSLEERFKYIDLGSLVRLGDPELQPEKGWFADLGYRHWGSQLTIQTNVFSHYLSDMIVEMPGQFVYNATDTLPALINSNVDRALLAGFEAQVNYVLFRNFVLLAQASYVRGMDLTNQGNLPLIAPLNGILGFKYAIPGIFSIVWNTTAHAAQNKIATGETASDGYLISDVSLFSAPREIGVANFQLFFGIDNLFDTNYVNHLATNRGLVKGEAGRNAYIKLRMKF